MATHTFLDLDRSDPLPYFAAGQWQSSQAERHGDVFNPSTGELIARVPFCTQAEVDTVIASAKAALPSWGNTPVVERARVLFAFRSLMDRHFDELAALVTREHGKTLTESHAEVQRGLEMVEFACGVPSLIMGQAICNIAAEVDGETIRHPVGVCVGITPFNFPSMVPLWMFPVSIVCGNAFILKPSEKVPLSALRLAELLQEAGLPEGVFNVVHGDAECVNQLLTHPDVSAISFVGSTRIARHVYETGTRHGKRVQAAGGAKNHLVVMPDADLDITVRALAASAFGCTGQRCMAGSLALTVGNIGDALVEQLVDYSSHLPIGPTDAAQSPVEVGPVIRPEAVARIAGFLDVAREEGATVALDGRRQFEHAGFFIGPSVVDQVRPDMRVAREEVFGPLLSVIRTGDLEEAIAIGQRCSYGNGASIFTRSGHAAREFKNRFNAGMIGINVGVPAPMAWLPFTGWNESFFGDLHIQGTESVHFYTRQKMTLTRWFASARDAHQDPVWGSKRG